MDEKIVSIEQKINELNILINDFKLQNQMLNKQEKRKIYNKKYYQKLKKSSINIL
jgi:hypothetical protein